MVMRWWIGERDWVDEVVGGIEIELELEEDEEEDMLQGRCFIKGLREL